MSVNRPFITPRIIEAALCPWITQKIAHHAMLRVERQGLEAVLSPRRITLDVQEHEYHNLAPCSVGTSVITHAVGCLEWTFHDKSFPLSSRRRGDCSTTLKPCSYWTGCLKSAVAEAGGSRLNGGHDMRIVALVGFSCSWVVPDSRSGLANACGAGR